MAQRAQFQVDLLFNANAQAAKTQLEQLATTLNNVANTQINVNSGPIHQASQAAQQLQMHLAKAVNVDTGRLNLNQFNMSLKQSGANLQQLMAKLQAAGPEGQAAFMQVSTAIGMADTSAMKLSGTLADFGKTLMSTIKWSIASSMIQGFVGGCQKAVGHLKDLNEALNDIRIVTGYSTTQMDQFASKAREAAKALNTTTDEFAKASLIFYQQGLSGDAVLERAEVVVKLAQVTGETSEQVSDYMTAIWNNFYDGSKSLEYYADVLTKLGAATATSTDEIAGGLEKFASVGQTIGLSFEYASAALATITSNTRQSEEVVGTALKTILSRIQGLKLGETLEDGVSLNKYSEALKAVGVDVITASGELRDMDDILDDLGEKWQILGSAQQAALAQTVAGIRQYNQFIALMDNWEPKNSSDSDSFLSNLDHIAEATGELATQQKIWSESWEAASKRMTQSTNELYEKLLDDSLFTGMLDLFSSLIDGISNFIDTIGGAGPALLLLTGILTPFLTKVGAYLTTLLPGFITGTHKKISALQMEQAQTFRLAASNEALAETDKDILRLTAQLIEKKAAYNQIQHTLTKAQQEQAKASFENAEAALVEAKAFEENRQAAERRRDALLGTLNHSAKAQSAFSDGAKKAILEKNQVNESTINRNITEKTLEDQRSRIAQAKQEQQAKLQDAVLAADIEKDAAAAYEKKPNAFREKQLAIAKELKATTEQELKVANSKVQNLEKEEQRLNKILEIKQKIETASKEEVAKMSMGTSSIKSNFISSNKTESDYHKKMMSGLAQGEGASMTETESGYASEASIDNLEKNITQQERLKGSIKELNGIQKEASAIEKSVSLARDKANALAEKGGRKYKQALKELQQAQDQAKNSSQQLADRMKKVAQSMGLSENEIEELTNELKNLGAEGSKGDIKKIEGLLHTLGVAGDGAKNDLIELENELKNKLKPVFDALGIDIDETCLNFHELGAATVQTEGGVRKLETSIETVKFSMSSLNTALNSTISGMSMLFSSFAMLKTLIDPNTDSMTKLTTAFMMLSMILPAINMLFGEQNRKAIASIILSVTKAKVTKDETGATVLQTGATWLQKIAQDALNGSMLAGLGIIGAVIIAIGLLVFAVIALINAFGKSKEASPEQHYKAAAKSAEQLTSALQEATTAAEELAETIEGYKEASRSLDYLVQGTEEYNKVLREANATASELIGSYGEIINGRWTYDSTTGKLIINEAALSDVAEYKAKGAETVDLAQSVAEADKFSWGVTMAGENYSLNKTIGESLARLWDLSEDADHSDLMKFIEEYNASLSDPNSEKKIVDGRTLYEAFKETSQSGNIGIGTYTDLSNLFSDQLNTEEEIEDGIAAIDRAYAKYALRDGQVAVAQAEMDNSLMRLGANLIGTKDLSYVESEDKNLVSYIIGSQVEKESYSKANTYSNNSEFKNTAEWYQEKAALGSNLTYELDEGDKDDTTDDKIVYKDAQGNEVTSISLDTAAQTRAAAEYYSSNENLFTPEAVQQQINDYQDKLESYLEGEEKIESIDSVLSAVDGNFDLLTEDAKRKIIQSSPLFQELTINSNIDKLFPKDNGEKKNLYKSYSGDQKRTTAFSNALSYSQGNEFLFQEKLNEELNTILDGEILELEESSERLANIQKKLLSGEELSAEESDYLDKLKSEFKELEEASKQGAEAYAAALNEIEEYKNREHTLKLFEKQGNITITPTMNTELLDEALDDYLDVEREIQINIVATAKDNVDNLKNKIDKISEATKLIGENMTVKPKDVEALEAEFEGILKNAKVLSDGRIQLDKAVTKEVIQNSKDRINQSYEEAIKELELEKEKLIQKRDADQKVIESLEDVLSAKTIEAGEESKIIDDITQAHEASAALQVVQEQQSGELKEDIVTDVKTDNETAVQAIVDTWKEGYAKAAIYANEGAKIQIEAADQIAKANWIAAGNDESTYKSMLDSSTVKEQWENWVKENYKEGTGSYRWRMWQAENYSEEDLVNMMMSDSKLTTRTLEDTDEKSIPKTAEEIKEWIKNNSDSSDYYDVLKDAVDIYYNSNGTDSEAAKKLQTYLENLKNKVKLTESQISDLDALILTLQGSKVGAYTSDNTDNNSSKNQIDEIERYHELEKAIKSTERALEKLNKEKERVYGKDKLKLIDEEIKQYDILIAQQEKLINDVSNSGDINDYLWQAKENLKQYSAEYDENGNLTNFDEMYAVEQAKLKKAYASQDEKAIEAAKKAYEDFEKAVQDYEETSLKYIEEKEKLEKLRYEKQLKQLEKITQKEKEINSIIEDRINLQQHYVKLAEYTDEKLSSTVKKQSSILTETASNIIATRNAMNEIVAMAEKEDRKLNATEITQLRTYASDLMSDIENMYSQWETIQKQYVNGLNKYTEEIDADIKRIGTMRDIVLSFKDIIDNSNMKLILDGTKELDNLNKQTESMLNSSLKLSNSKLKSLNAEYNGLEKVYNDLNKKLGQKGLTSSQKTELLEQIEVTQDKMLAVQKEITDNWSTALKDADALFTLAIDQALDKFAGAMTEFSTLAQAREAFKWGTEENERYLSDADKIYELNKLNRQITADITKNTGLLAKSKLADVLAEVEKHQKSSTELSQIELDNLRAKYELRLAEIALEEAQNNKTQMRLQRNSNGSWNYVYTANQDAIDKAAQNVDDKQKALRDLNEKNIQGQSEAILSNYESYEKAYQTIADKITNKEYKDKKELDRDIQNLSKYVTKDAYLRKQMESSLKELGISYKDTLLGQIEGADSLMEKNKQLEISHKDLTETLDEAWKDYEANLKTIAESAGTSYEKLGSDAKNLANDYIETAKDLEEEISKTIKEMQIELPKISAEILKVAKDWDQKLQGMIDKTHQLIEAIMKAIEKAMEMEDMIPNVGYSLSNKNLTEATESLQDKGKIRYEVAESYDHEYNYAQIIAEMDKIIKSDDKKVTSAMKVVAQEISAWALAERTKIDPNAKTVEAVLKLIPESEKTNITLTGGLEYLKAVEKSSGLTIEQLANVEEVEKETEENTEKTAENTEEISDKTDEEIELEDKTLESTEKINDDTKDISEVTEETRDIVDKEMEKTLKELNSLDDSGDKTVLLLTKIYKLLLKLLEEEEVGGKGLLGAGIAMQEQGYTTYSTQPGKEWKDEISGNRYIQGDMNYAQAMYDLTAVLKYGNVSEEESELIKGAINKLNEDRNLMGADGPLNMSVEDVLAEVEEARKVRHQDALDMQDRVDEGVKFLAEAFDVNIDVNVSGGSSGSSSGGSSGSGSSSGTSNNNKNNPSLDLSRDYAKDYKDAYAAGASQATLDKIVADRNAKIDITGQGTKLTGDQILALETGGYTGHWEGEEGRLALLHKKELVLNRHDTEKMLEMVKMVRSMAPNILDGIRVNAGSMYTSLEKDLYNKIHNPDSHNTVEQNVHIEANFPNVESASDIKEALNSLVNEAAQRASVYKLR